MARQYFTVKVQVADRQYIAVGDATARDANPQAAAQQRAFRKIGEVFPETLENRHQFRVLEVKEGVGDAQTRKLATPEEKAATHRNSIVWTLLREARHEDPLKTIADYAAKTGQPNTGYANVANALAWKVESVMKADVKRAWAVSILNDLDGRNAFGKNWMTFSEDEFEGYVQDGGAFDEVIDHFQKTALRKVLETGSTSSSTAHNMLAQIERDVAADIYKWLTDGSTWF